MNHEVASELHNLEQAIRAQPAEMSLILRRGELLESLGDYSGALRDYEASLAQGFQPGQALAGRARIHLMRYEATAAIEVGLQALKLDPYESRVYLTLGEAYRQTAEFLSAETALFTALHYSPNDPSVYLAVSRLFLEPAFPPQPERALAWARRASQLSDPRDWYCHSILASAYFATHDVHAAVKHQKAAVRWAPPAMKQQLQVVLASYRSTTPLLQISDQPTDAQFPLRDLLIGTFWGAVGAAAAANVPEKRIGPTTVLYFFAPSICFVVSFFSKKISYLRCAWILFWTATALTLPLGLASYFFVPLRDPAALLFLAAIFWGVQFSLFAKIGSKNTVQGVVDHSNPVVEELLMNCERCHLARTAQFVVSAGFNPPTKHFLCDEHGREMFDQLTSQLTAVPPVPRPTPTQFWIPVETWFLIIRQFIEPQWVYLREAKGTRYLPLTMAHHETEMIRYEMERKTQPGLLSHHVMASTIAATGFSIHDILIHSRDDAGYKAKVRIHKNSVPVEIDIRPSDAIALALFANKPLFLDQHLFATG